MRGLRRFGADAARWRCCWHRGSAPARRRADYPNQPIRLMVGFTRGFGRRHQRARARPTAWARFSASRSWSRTKPGAGSNIAADFVARAPKDGYTLFLAGLRRSSPTRRSTRSCRSTSSRISRRSRWSTRSTVDRWWCTPSLGVNSVQGADRAGEVEARRVALRLDRRRHRAASRRRTVHAARPALKLVHVPYHGQPAGGDRPARRPRHT